MPSELIPLEYAGWWRITETGTWVNDGLDILGPALISFTGYGDRLRMHCLLAYVTARVRPSGEGFLDRLIPAPGLETARQETCRLVVQEDACARDPTRSLAPSHPVVGTHPAKSGQ